MDIFLRSGCLSLLVIELILQEQGTAIADRD
jgi:hypothetical protein